MRRVGSPRFAAAKDKLWLVPRVGLGSHSKPPGPIDAAKTKRSVSSYDVQVNPRMSLVEIGNDLERTNVRAGDWFEPYGLPDAGGWRVPDAFGFADLFAAGLGAAVGGVGDGDGQ